MHIGIDLDNNILELRLEWTEDPADQPELHSNNSSDVLIFASRRLGFTVIIPKVQ